MTESELPPGETLLLTLRLAGSVPRRLAGELLGQRVAAQETARTASTCWLTPSTSTYPSISTTGLICTHRSNAYFLGEVLKYWHGAEPRARSYEAHFKLSNPCVA